MAIYNLALDYGASGTRAILSEQKTFKLLLFLMSSKIIAISKSVALQYNQSTIGVSNPFSSGTIELSGRYYCFGMAAEEQKADEQLEVSKFELAVVKTLAMMGAISEDLNLSKNINFNLGTLLPASEYQSERHLFESSLKIAITNFQFCGRHKAFVVKNFTCLPEGGGVLLQGRKPGSSLKDSNLAVIMLGYRDVSILPVKAGSLGKGISKKIGFHDLCHWVGNQIAFHDYQKIAQVICGSRKLSSKHLELLLTNPDSLYKSQKIAQVKEAVKEGRKQYLFNLSNWIKAGLERDLGEVIVAGGSAYYFRGDLQKLLQKFGIAQINWGDELEERIKSSFGSQIDTHSLNYRLGDVYGLFFYIYSRN